VLKISTSIKTYNRSKDQANKSFHWVEYNMQTGLDLLKAMNKFCLNKIMIKDHQKISTNIKEEAVHL
jgi:hypothetical protein